MTQRTERISNWILTLNDLFGKEFSTELKILTFPSLGNIGFLLEKCIDNLLELEFKSLLPIDEILPESENDFYFLSTNFQGSVSYEPKENSWFMGTTDYFNGKPGISEHSYFSTKREALEKLESIFSNRIRE